MGDGFFISTRDSLRITADKIQLNPTLLIKKMSFIFIYIAYFHVSCFDINDN